MENNELKFGLGRVLAKDPRDEAHPLRQLLPPVTKKTILPTYKYWNDNGWWGNQQTSPQCVAYAWAHWIEDGPVTHKGVAPIIKPATIYKEAQLVDEWPGEDYEGTSVRAGAKVLKEKGLVSAYYWAWDLQTLVDAVLTTGPVVVGTNWYVGMFFPNADHVIEISGYIAGGHAYVINGVNTKTKLFRVKNSWGKQWGKDGHAYISFKDMERLIAEQGEICLATEVPDSK